MKESSDLNEMQERLMNEAAEWRLISLLFDCPTEGWARDAAELSKEVRDPKLRKACEKARKEASEGLYHSIFGPGGPAPGREVSYRAWVQPGYLISEISAFYKAFSFTPRTLETPDHVSVEAGFIAYLKLKEAFAVSFGDTESAAVTSEASRKFIDEHLTKIAEPLARSLSSSGIEYLAMSSKALFDRTGEDKDKKVRESLPVLTDPEDGVFECGTAP